MSFEHQTAKYNEVEKYKGVRLKFRKGETEFEGVVIGLGDSAMAGIRGKGGPSMGYKNGLSRYSY